MISLEFKMDADLTGEGRRHSSSKQVNNPIIRLLLICSGWIALACAVIGIFLPLVPTVPLLLLAAACFLRSSQRLHAWLVEHPRLGPLVADYLEGKGIPRKARQVAIATVWTSIPFSAGLFVSALWLRILLLVVAICVTWYLLSLPEKRDSSPSG